MDALATHWRLPPDQFPGQPLATVLYGIDDRTVVITEVMSNGRDVLADLPADVVRAIERDVARGGRIRGLESQSEGDDKRLRSG